MGLHPLNAGKKLILAIFKRKESGKKKAQSKQGHNTCPNALHPTQDTPKP